MILLICLAFAPPEPATGRIFKANLAKPLQITRDGDALRDVLSDLGPNRSIAILRDRRVDPDASVTYNGAAMIKDTLKAIAKKRNADISVVGNAVYFGPPNKAKLLRTLVEIKTAEVRTSAADLIGKKRLELLGRKTTKWQKLATPREILTTIARSHGARFDESQLKTAIPHDLWNAGVLPQMSLAESLTLVLIQFDRTFSMGKDGALRIEPLPQQIAITKSYFSRRVPPAQAIAELAKIYPHIKPQQAGRSLKIAATVEEHEAIGLWIRTGKVAMGDPVKPDDPAKLPLNRRTFTLDAKNIPADQLIVKLNQSGMAIKYNPEALKAAGIDITKRVTFTVKEVRANEFFTKLFDPLGMKFSINGKTVTASPK